MHRCEFCGTELPGNASFCGHCGRASSNPAESLTGVSGFPVLDAPDSRTMISAHGIAPSGATGQARNYETISNENTAMLPAGTGEENEEEKRRRAALIGMALPLLGDGARGAGNVPMVHGTPQIANVPSVPGTPQGPGNALGQLAQGPGSQSPWYSQPTLRNPQPPAHMPAPPHAPHHPTSPGNPSGSPTTGSPQGCIVALVVVLVTIFLILSSVVGLAFTVWSPVLSALSGTTNVIPGGVLQLHGEHFIPGSSVGLTLDNTMPVVFNDTNTSQQRIAAMNKVSDSGLATTAMNQLPLAGNIVSVKGDGTFDVKITIDPTWPVGKHLLRAAEKLSPRSATLPFTIHQPGTQPTPTSTSSPTATPTTTVTPTVTPTPTVNTTTSGLSCVNPGSVTLGPVSEGYKQPASQTISLCTTGTSTVVWTANWNASQAPWLQLNATSGQIQAPGQQQLTVSGNASALKLGNYKAAITFSDAQGSAPLTLNVSFTVQAGCITATPAALSFTGVAGISDPAPQTTTISNCGAVETWTASLQLDTTQPWLNLSQSSGTLNSKAAQSITVTASDTKVQMPPGTYKGKILFVSGSSLFTINITFTVQPAPTLVLLRPATPAIQANSYCQFNANGGPWLCPVLIGSSRSSPTNLTWSASSSGVPGISFTPAGGTLAPGQTVTVEVSVPQNSCQTATTLTFKGPGNTLSIAWSCSPPIH